MSIHLQPPVPLVTLIKTEPPTIIKNELPEKALEEDISTDVKEDIDIVYHPLSKDLIKSETVLEDILENKHLKSVQTQAIVKAENSPFIKTENITQRNKSEDTSDGNVNRGTGHGVVEVQASNEHYNALSKLKTDKQSILNFSKNLNGISVRRRKSKSPKKTGFAEYYKTDDTTLWKKEKEKIKVIKALVILVEAHEYTSLVNGKHVCNHCQHACNNLNNLKLHINKMHRDVATMYHCPYCSYKSKWKHHIKQHIIPKHKDAKDIQWFQCHLCEKKFKLKSVLTKHKEVHLTHEQMQDGLDLKSHTDVVITLDFLEKYDLRRSSALIGQAEGDILFLRGGIFHQVINVDNCFNEAINYGTLEWNIHAPLTELCRFPNEKINAIVKNPSLVIATKSSNLKLHNCPMADCPARFVHLLQLNRHLQDVHQHHPFCCEYCKRKYSSKQTLDRHNCKNNPNQVTKYYICNVCVVRVLRWHDHRRSKGHIMNEARRLAAGTDDADKFEEPTLLDTMPLLNRLKYKHVCDVCTKCFIKKQRLITHINKVHLAPDAANTDDAKTTVSVGSMKSRANQLTPCPLCKKMYSVFSIPQHLKIRNKYRCSRCDVGFSIKRKFELHEKHCAAPPIV